MKTNREIRESLGIPQLEIAHRAHVAEVTVRVFEAEPTAVKRTVKREALERVYADLRATATAGKAERR